MVLFTQVSMLFLLLLGFSACKEGDVEKKVKEVLEKHPEYVIDVLEKNPEKVLNALQKAIEQQREQGAKKQQEDQEKAVDQMIEKPLAPKIAADEVIRGTKGAPIVLVGYSDFECPYCTRGFAVVTSLLNKPEYKGKIQFIYKHLPLNFHPNARPAARYYEAIKDQSHELAIKFHDAVFEQQGKLKNGEKFLQEVAKKINVNMKKLEESLKNSKIDSKIDEDMKEAEQFSIEGTPGFILNGVAIRGAYPEEYFIEIIKKLQAAKKLSL